MVAQEMSDMVDFPMLAEQEQEHAVIFGAMNRLLVLPETVIQRLQLFTDEQVLQMRQYAREWGQKAWLLECACDAEIKRRDKLRGGRGNKDIAGVGCVAAIDQAARDAGVSRRTIYRNAEIYETFFEENDDKTIVRADNSLLLDDKQYYKEALNAPDPHVALEAMAERKADNPYYSTRDAREDVERLKFQAKTERLAELKAAAPEQAALLADFPVVYADPPWRYDDSTTSPNRFIENQYPTMDLDEICAMPVASWVAKDAILFLWATSPKLKEALRVMAAWGFVYRTNMVWIKDKIGLGHWVRQQHELLLIGRRGSFPTPDPSVRPSSVIEAPRGVHSVKPTEMYDTIETMYPNLAYLELFARTARPGWTAWGNQAPVGVAE